MGGGQGFDPTAIITSVIFGSPQDVFASTATALLGSGDSRRAADTGAARAASEVQAAEREAAEQAVQNAELRRREQRQRAQAALLDQAHARSLAAQAGDDARAQTLGTPTVDTSNLKEKLGQ